MDVYVLDKSLKVQGICDDYKSIIWTPRYYTAGDFELYLPATEKNIQLLKEDFFVVRDKNLSLDGSTVIRKNVMVIEKVQITTDVENGNYLTITGRCLKSLLARRVIWQQTTLYGLMELALRQLIIDNAISPALTKRKIPNLALADKKGFTDRIDRQVTGTNLYDFICEVCTTYGIGWEVYTKDNTFIVDFYKGTDRSYNQSTNAFVVFSPDFDNLLSTDYQYDKTNYKNVALVAGEGEGLDRRTMTVGDSSGLDRYEIYVDSRDTSSNDGEIGSTDYNKMLTEEGEEALSDDANTITESIEGQIETSSNYRYEKDYFLGDVVQIINEYGIGMAARITEVIENEDDTGKNTIPTFSKAEV